MQKKMKIVYTNHAMERLMERSVCKAEVTRTVRKAKKKLKHMEKMRLYNPNHDLYIGVIRKHNDIIIQSLWLNESGKQRYTNKVVC